MEEFLISMVFDLTHLKKLRKQLELTQHQFAQKIGISQSMLAKIEAGKLDPTYSYVKKIEIAIDFLTKSEEKEARDIMIEKIIKAKPEDNASSIISLMKKNNISQLPIFKKSRVVGLVTESSILEKRLKEIKNLKAKDLMKETPPIINKNTKISVITSLLKHYPIVLVSKEGRIEGLIAKSDLLNILI